MTALTKTVQQFHKVTSYSGGWTKHVNNCNLFKQIMLVCWCKHKNACLIYLFPFTVLYKWSPQHTKNHCGKQLHKASGNHSRHLTWHFPIVFSCISNVKTLPFDLHQPELMFTFLAPHMYARTFTLYVCLKAVTGCLALCRRQWANFLSIGVLLCVRCFD